MATNKPTRRLHALGQSLWLDGVGRTLLRSGELSRYIAELSVTGLRFDLGVIEHAMGNDPAYDDSIRVLAAAKLSDEEQFFELALEDLTQAAELLRPIFDASGGEEGWVSLGISPLLADSAADAIRAASRLHSKAALANLFVQIPGTPEGVRAIEEIVFDGIAIDVTLLFSPEHYLAAAKAYMSGLERRWAAGLAVGVESVPLHMAPTLAVIRFAEEHFPGIAQVACFDTAFHAAMPDVASTLAIPQPLRSQGIQRYGFHGLSCESIAHQLADRLPGRLLIAHLGNGASVTAVREGISIDTSMGLTPSGGLIMGTRSGDLDPGVLIFLMREKGFDAARLEDLVDHRAGLLGISGVASDMRRLHDPAAANADVRLAIEMFCYSVRKELAAMTAVLGGVDAIVFTGGIGENDVDVRGAICAGLAWAGIRLDEPRNRAGKSGLISESSSSCAVHVLASREDEQIARHTAALL